MRFRWYRAVVEGFVAVGIGMIAVVLVVLGVPPLVVFVVSIVGGRVILSFDEHGPAVPRSSRSGRTRWVLHQLWQAFRRILVVVGICAVVKVPWFWWYASTGYGLVAKEGETDLMERRAYLMGKVAAPSFGPSVIPSFVPSPFREELAIASLSMTTVALTNLAFRYPETRSSAKQAVAQMINTMLTPAIRRYEVLWWGEDALEALDGEAGHIGYLGHLNLMLGCYRLVGGGIEFDQLFIDLSTALERRLKRRRHRHAETFPGAIFTADNTIVILSLRLHDIVFSPRFQGVIGEWIAYSREHLTDPQTGMLRYYVSRLGLAHGTARGVLQAWNSMWLPLIDEAWGRDQYDRMKRLLLESTRFGNFLGIREYPPGETGPTDAIAGPIVLGVSASATGFGMGGAVLWQDEEILGGLLRTAELVGGTLSWGGTRSYLFAPLPGEAVVLAARTMYRWDGRYCGGRDRSLMSSILTPSTKPYPLRANALMSSDV